jgi:protein TonB
MRRRRQKNNLLPKMIGIAVLINAVLLPVLAQIGAFKAVTAHYAQVKLITLPPPESKPVEAKREPPKRQPDKPKVRPAKRPGKEASRPSRPNPAQPMVVASTNVGDSGDGPEIENNGTALPGQLPVTGDEPSVPVTPEPAHTEAPTLPTPETPVAEPPKTVEPVQSPPAPPHEAVTVAAAPLNQPQPALPDDLLESDLHATFRALFTVHPDGTASVKMLSSTGNAQLDRIALAAAQRWTFRPATVDGKPVESYLRLAVEFEVS